MVPEYFEVLYSDYIVIICRVFFHEVKQDLNFYSSLMLETFLVPDYFDSHVALSFMV
jgi:hypothetical protein